MSNIVESDSGGRKEKKLAAFSLIPQEPLWALAEVYGRGAEKYAAHNWRKGYDWSLSYDALHRHVNLFWQGKRHDLETGAHHLDSAAFHVFALRYYDLYYDVYGRFDDRYYGKSP